MGGLMKRRERVERGKEGEREGGGEGERRFTSRVMMLIGIATSTCSSLCIALEGSRTIKAGMVWEGRAHAQVHA